MIGLATLVRDDRVVNLARHFQALYPVGLIGDDRAQLNAVVAFCLMRHSPHPSRL
jgi:hypothetical protein